MSKNTEELQKELDAKIPREMVSERAAWDNGPKLSFLPSWYVIDRMNQTFGQSRWSYSIVELKCVFDGKVNEKFYTSYTCIVNMTTTFPDGTVRIDSDVGFGDGQDKNNPGKTHELATKEAVTDGLKRCAKSLGMSLGLALYDKAQDFVADEKPATTPTKPKETKNEPANAKTGRSPARTSSASGKNNAAVAPQLTTPAPKPDAAAVPAGDATGSSTQSPSSTDSGTPFEGDLGKLTAQITAAARVLDRRGTVKLPDFAAGLKEKYKVTAIGQLTTGQAVEVYNNIKATHTFLGLQ